MARPQKAGIDYFPLDVYMEQDDKIALIEAKYGIIGFGTIIKLYKKIYGGNGYYYEWNERNKLLFSKYAGVELTQLDEIINSAIEWDLFDKKLYDSYGILTSKRIQKTYIDASYRKKQVELYKEFLLSGINEYINRDNVVINSINDDINPQIKTNKTKLKETKTNKDIPTPKTKYADYVSLTEEEYQKLIIQYGEKNTKAFINKLNAYKGANGKKYKSDYLAILSWVIDEILNKGGVNVNANRNTKRFENERLDDSEKAGFFANAD
jgi:hypothetical protein